MRIAAIINDGARRLDARTRAALAAALPRAVAFTRSLAEARAAIRDHVARGIDLLVLGGGDGTVVMGLALLEEACRGAGRPEPALGALRLGTECAFAAALGAGPDPAADLRRLARGEAAWRAQPLVRARGLRAPYVGAGLAAQRLEDRAAIAGALERVPGARRLVGDAARGALSLALRSVPRLAAARRPRAAIANTGAPARDLVGGREVAAPATLWSGAFTLLACATIPHPGLGLRALAAAPGPARFQVRCADAGLRELARGAAGPLGGDRLAGRAHDFLCDRVEIRLDSPTAFELGGELLGRLDRLELSLAPPVTVAALARDP